MNVFISIDQHGRKQVCVFLPRDAVIVCPSDRVSQSVLYRNEIELVLAWRFTSTYPTLCYKEISVSPNIGALPSGTLSQTTNLTTNFAMSCNTLTLLVQLL